MPSSIQQRSFSSGELAPSLYGRADVDKYAQGLKTCRNFLVERSGGAANRTGSRFLAEVRDSSVRTYLIKFVFNDDQTYVIEAGNFYFRFYRAGGRIGGDAPYQLSTPYLAADVPDLNYVQSADVITIVHPNYAAHELTRRGHADWSLTPMVFAPLMPTPAGLAVTAGVAGTTVWRYQITALGPLTYEESLPSASASAQGGEPALETPNVLTWVAVPPAVEYNVYREVQPGNGVYGFLGVAKTAQFNDPGIIPDESFTPPIARDPFAGAGNKPSAVTYYQQRLVFANTLLNPETVEASKTGNFHNFTISSPLQDDDAVRFTLAGRTVQAIRHMLEIDRLILLTDGGIWTIEGTGGEETLLLPTAINARQRSHHGSSKVRPAIVGRTAVYVQARGGIVRDLSVELTVRETVVTGKDLTLYSSHLFDGRTIERMDFAEIPHSIVWAVRSDGVLLGLTYLPEFELWGWHRHDTAGSLAHQFEDVCVVPEGNEDAVYVVVKRTLANGNVGRYVERFASRYVTDVAVDAFFLDSYLAYDGRNGSPVTVSVFKQNPVDPDGWLAGRGLNLIFSTALITPIVIGDVIVVRSGADSVRVTVNTVVSPTTVNGISDRDVEVSLRQTALQTWERAVAEVGGLDHLEGETVGILADGNVFPQDVVTGGRVQLSRAATLIRVGLPITADLETLDLDSVQQAIRDKRKQIASVTLLVEASRGGWIGPDAANLFEMMPVNPSLYADPLKVVTGLIEADITAAYSEERRVFVRQLDPLPLAVLSVIPSVKVGG